MLGFERVVEDVGFEVGAEGDLAMLILEGPDGSGKTTLAQELCKAFNLTYEHSGPPSPEENLFRTYQRRLQNAQPGTVFDRLFHGEAVYGPLLRGGSRLDEVQLAYLELEATTAGAMVVWCTADPAALEGRGDPIYQKLHPNTLLAGYWGRMQRSFLPCVGYNSSTQGSMDVIKNLIRIGYAPRKTRWPYIGVGNPQARTCLLGEKHPGKWPEVWERELRHVRPFDTSRSGRWLMEALMANNYYLPELVYVTNAFKQGSTARTLMEELMNLPHLQKVVCLGHEAEAELKRKGGIPGVEVVRVPHPAHAARFETHVPGKWRGLLYKALGWEQG